MGDKPAELEEWYEKVQQSKWSIKSDDAHLKQQSDYNKHED